MSTSPNPSHKRPLRILFLTSGPQVPSTRFRILQYIPGLEAAGHTCHMAHSRPPKYRGWRLLGNRASEVPRALFRLIDWARCIGFQPDVVVIERELFSSGFGLLERAFRKIAPAMVLDVDDAIFLPHPRKFRRLATMCDLAIAGNSLLAERIQIVNPRVVVIPTSLDTTRYASKPQGQQDNRRLVLGWTGTEHNLASLRVISGALQSLSKTHHFELAIIAERPPSPEALALSGLDIRFLPWRAESEIADLHRFDIGLMPLEASEWTLYKCGLKILQYMAIGIPAVASPVGVNREIIQNGANGLLASTEAEWTAHLARLLDDPAFRQRLGTAGRETVEQRYSVAANLPRFEQALYDAVAAADNAPRSPAG